MSKVYINKSDHIEKLRREIDRAKQNGGKADYIAGLEKAIEISNIPDSQVFVDWLEDDGK